MHLKALRKKFLNCSLLLALFSCSGGEVRQKVDDSYVTSGVEQFFLPELPGWANFSEAGRCYKSTSLQYLDFPKVSVNYQLSYPEMIELQGQYNERREDYFSSTAYRFLKPVEEAAFFSNAVEQVRGGVRHFKLPSVPQVEIIWLEGFVQHNKVDEIKKMATSGRFNERLPVLFSSCLSRQRLNQWIQEHDLSEAGFYMLSAEWLSPFGSNNQLQGGLRLEVMKLLNPGTKVSFLVPVNTILPLELTL